MRQLLIGPLCGWPVKRVTVVSDASEPIGLPGQLIDWYAQATDVALFYYVGHGQVDDEDELCLGLTGSRSEVERRAATSLTFRAVRNALRASPAPVKVVILDCCFAGQAIHRPHYLTGRAGELVDPATPAGAYILAATGPYGSAWFDDSSAALVPHTHFTWHLADIVERGIPGEGDELTVEPIYRRLREAMAAAGRSFPVATSHDFPGGFVFARNAASRLSKPASTDQRHSHGPDRWFRLLDEAEQAARSVSDPDQQAMLLTEIAQAAMQADAHRARRLLNEADRVASVISEPNRQFYALIRIAETRSSEDPGRARQSLEQAAQLARAIDDKYAKIDALRQVARIRLEDDPAGAEQTFDDIPDPEFRASSLELLVWDMARRDPDRAERIARSITKPRNRAERLLTVGDIVSPWDPARARRVFDEADRISRTLTGQDRSAVLVSLAVSLAATDPARAERTVWEIGDPWYEASAWIDIATLRADKDSVDATISRLQSADHAAGKVPDCQRRSGLLGQIVRAMAPLDSGKAESIARQINPSDSIPNWQADALMALVKALATDDPGRAERIARHIVDLEKHALALTTVAMAVYRDDRLNAEWLLANAERIATAGGETQILTGMAKIIAESIADRAEQIVRKIKSPGEVLRDISVIISARDLDHAEQIAGTISEPALKAQALTSLAQKCPPGT